MCLAIPAKVVKVKQNGRADIEIAGKRQEISLLLLPEIRAGDYVLVNLGQAITKLDEDEATEVLRLYQEITQATAY